MVGLDVTYKAVMTRAHAERLRASADGHARRRVLRLLRGTTSTSTAARIKPIHDALAVAHLLDGTLLETVARGVVVDTGGESAAAARTSTWVAPRSQRACRGRRRRGSLHRAPGSSGSSRPAEARGRRGRAGGELAPMARRKRPARVRPKTPSRVKKRTRGSGHHHLGARRVGLLGGGRVPRYAALAGVGGEASSARPSRRHARPRRRRSQYGAPLLLIAVGALMLARSLLVDVRSRARARRPRPGRAADPRRRARGRDRGLAESAAAPSPRTLRRSSARPR